MNEQYENSDVAVNREYKSDVFKAYFSQKKELIELYNALNDTKYTVDDEVTINTLDNAIFLKIYNDVSFVLRNTVNLYEHQSTVNQNMPLRDLFYINDIYKAEASGYDLYGYKQIKLPTPRFVVFYNGTADAPEEEVVKLSDAYMQFTDTPELELTVTVLNINYGHNKELMDKCVALRDYSTFVQRVRDNVNSGMKLEPAVEDAVDSCIQDHVMEEFLIREKAGVIRMHVLDFNEELHNQSLVEYGVEQGIAIGAEQEREKTEFERKRADEAETRASDAETRADEAEGVIAGMLRNGQTPETIASLSGLPIDHILAISESIRVVTNK
ncbi:MAG: hypothetical protein IJS12_10135 [Lachnospiraceae bacterium]|nr:hypothetical protein [Lachnospiraceae bacterium]